MAGKSPPKAMQFGYVSMEFWVLQIIVCITTLTTAIVMSAMLLLQKKKRRHRNRISSVASPLQHRLVVQRLLNTLTARPSVQGRGLRVVFIAVGTRGFVQPCLALAKELQKRGHFPLIISTKKFQKFIESHGIQCGTIYNETIGHSSGWNTFPSASELLSAAMLQKSEKWI